MSSSHSSSSSMYKIREQPLGATKHVRIVIIGAGASGINMLRALRENLTNYDAIVYEKNASVGGTWFENRYPGCRCDVPSHSYQFSWRPNREWTNFFASAEEIETYLCKICEEEGLVTEIKTGNQVVNAEWHEGSGQWMIKVKNLATDESFTDRAHFLLDGSGILNDWVWPDVEGLHTYKGELVHTAHWPKNFSIKGKSVAVIGNGSSGVQILPQIQPDVKKLHHVVRTPTWVLPPRLQTMKIMGKIDDVLSQIEVDEHENFSAATINKFETDHEFYRAFLKSVDKEANNNFPVMLKDSPVQAFSRIKAAEYMSAMLGGDDKLCKALIPSFPLGARRVTPAPGYLEALRQPNVQIVTGDMRRFLPDGIEMDSGEVLKVDAIVCATGFNLSFCPRFPIVGRKGNLQDIRRKETPRAYMSCAVAGIPNYFSFLGPNGPIAHGSVFTLTEHIARYVVRVIAKCQTEGIRTITPSQAAEDEFAEHVRAFMPRTTWSAGSCRSWFKGGRADGPVTALHPGSRIHFFQMLEHFRGEDWEYTYDCDSDDNEDLVDGGANGHQGSKAIGQRGNRFRYLGNGFSAKELDPSADLAWYLDEPNKVV